MNRLAPGKLVGSKWTACSPRDREKHFVVTHLVERGEGARRVGMEAVHSGRRFTLEWCELEDESVWQRGWREASPDPAIAARGDD